jgi:hypothetical protein
MLSLSADALAIVQRSYTMEMRVESWLGSQLLSSDVPVNTGSETLDRASSIPESVTLQLPRLDRGMSWDPLVPDHPVAAYGQRLRISFGVQTGFGTEWIKRGWFLVTGSQLDQDTVTVNASGLLALIDEAKFVAPFEPSGTFSSTLRGLVEPALTVSIDGALADRSVPVGFQWDTDRLAGLFELLDAWPATAHVDENGVLVVTKPPTVLTPVASLTDAAGGTVIRWQGLASRDGGFNIVVCKGEDSSGNQIIGTASDVDSNSPMRISGPFNPLPVPFEFSSPLMSTVAQCRAAAATILERKRRTATRKITARMVPHPGLQIGDAVTVTGPELDSATATIEQMVLPYNPIEQTMQLVV